MSNMPRHPDHNARKTHMAQRAVQGATIRQIADEFSISRSQAHRNVKAARDKADNVLRRGYIQEPIK